MKIKIIQIETQIGLLSSLSTLAFNNRAHFIFKYASFPFYSWHTFLMVDYLPYIAFYLIYQGFLNFSI